MTCKNFLRVGFPLLLSWLLGSSPALAVTTPAGQVISVERELRAVQPQQAPRVLQRGSLFYAQDTLQTAATGGAQLRFTDGTLIVLRPSTQFKIARYNADAITGSDVAAPAEYAVSLLQGGLRSISGKIAKLAPDHYTLTTDVATIGVRGTEFSLVLDAAGGLGAATYQGAIYVRNSGGKLEIGDGADFRYAYVATATSKPQGQPVLPSFMLNDPRIISIKNLNAPTTQKAASPESICLS